MNWDRIEGNWKQLRGKVQQQWGKLTDDDLTTIEGRRVELVGKIQERYGIARDEAEKQVDSWISGICRQVSVSRASSRLEEVEARLSLAISPTHEETWARSIVRVPLP